MWKGLNEITNYKTPSPSTVENQQLAEDLNELYCRFKKTPHTLSEHLSTQPLGAGCLVQSYPGAQHAQNSITHFFFIVTSPQHKCLGEWHSYERAPDSAEKQQTIYLWTDSAKKKKKQTIYIWTDSAKNCTGAFTVLQTVQKNNNSNLHMDRQCKKATAIYIWTVHIYRLYRRQCAKYTYIYSVHIVYYKDILNYQRHIIHRMGTSTLCTVSIHNVCIMHSNNVRCNRL